jgi:hypothetical protein
MQVIFDRPRSTHHKYKDHNIEIDFIWGEPSSIIPISGMFQIGNMYRMVKPDKIWTTLEEAELEILEKAKHFIDKNS